MGPNQFGSTYQISWLLMPWLLLASSKHQHPWYWLCRMGKFLWSFMKGCSIPRAMSMWKNNIKYKYTFVFPLNKNACKGLIPYADRYPITTSQYETSIVVFCAQSRCLQSYYILISSHGFPMSNHKTKQRQWYDHLIGLIFPFALSLMLWAFLIFKWYLLVCWKKLYNFIPAHTQCITRSYMLFGLYISIMISVITLLVKKS